MPCIGNGNWGGPVFQAQALAVNNGLIYARDKNGKVSIYKESEATQENYQKTKRYRQGVNSYFYQCALCVVRV